MTRKEAQEKAVALEAMHPWIGDYEWQIREASSDDWIVVKVPAQPLVPQVAAQQAKIRRAPRRTSRLRSPWGGSPSAGA